MPNSRVRARRGRLGFALLWSALMSVSIIAIWAGTAQAEVPSLTLSASSSAVTVTGTPQAGGVNIITNSTGLKEPGILLFKLKPGATASELLTFVANPKADPNGASKFGAITFDNEAPSGKGDEAQTTLEPGEYVVLVTGEKGPSGTHASFTVAASPAAAVALPAAQATIKSIDFGFKGPSTIKTGEVVGFEDAGFLVHMDFAFPVKNKKAASKLLAALKSGKEKGVEKLFAGPPVSFAGPVSPGAYQQETITAKPGWYVQVCFMETQDGRPHTRLGMERLLHIVK
jgi:hypothetical protein